MSVYNVSTVLLHYEQAYQAFAGIYGGDTDRKVTIHILRHKEFSTTDPSVHQGYTDGENCYLCWDCAKSSVIPHLGLLAEIGHVFNSKYLGPFRTTGVGAFPYLWLDEGLANFLRHVVADQLGYRHESSICLEESLGYAKRYMTRGHTWISRWGLSWPMSAEETLEAHGMAVYIIKHITDNFGLETFQRLFTIINATKSEFEYRADNELAVYLLSKAAGKDLRPVFNDEWKFSLTSNFSGEEGNFVERAAVNLATKALDDLTLRYTDFANRGYRCRWIEEQIILARKCLGQKQNLDTFRIADITSKRIQTEITAAIVALEHMQNSLRSAQATGVSAIASERLVRLALQRFNEGQFVEVVRLNQEMYKAVQADQVVQEAEKEIERALREGRTEGLQKAREQLNQAIQARDLAQFSTVVPLAMIAKDLAFKATFPPDSILTDTRLPVIFLVAVILVAFLVTWFVLRHQEEE